MLPHLRDLSAPRDLATPATQPNVQPVAEPDGEIHIRPLASLDEYQACVALQIDVWGAEFTDVVPASVLQVAAHIGGLVIGAFAGDALLGFVFGLTGVKDGEIVHWSHMLGVRARAREAGIGRRLKEYQRAELAHHGVAREFWTFDPLQARNAHFNVNRLGVRVIDYVVNMYGTTGSPLHLGVATDRLIVEWSTNSASRPTPPDVSGDPTLDGLPILTPAPRPGDCLLDGDRPRAALIEIPTDIQAVGIEVPTDIQAVAAPSTEMMLRWRMATRAHFQWAFLHGYRVAALHRNRDTARAFYVISRDPGTPATPTEDPER